MNNRPIGARYANGRPCLPSGWGKRPGRLFIVEGASDALAMTAANLCCMGRPSNMGGVEHLVALLRDFPADRPIVAMGENDRKPDGTWPGKAGAESVAGALAKRLNRVILIAYPSAGSKDVRKWLTNPDRSGIEWPDRGRQLLEPLTASAVRIDPPSPGGDNQTKDNAAPADVLLTRTMASLRAKPVRYHVPGRIAYGKVHLAAGRGGGGKSTAFRSLAADSTRGKCAFGLAYDPPEPIDVLLVCAEDTILPGLAAEGANLERVHLEQGMLIGGKKFGFQLAPDTIELVHEKLKANPAIELIVIDPVASYIGGKITTRNRPSCVPP